MEYIDFLIWIGAAGCESDLDKGKYGPGSHDTINGYLAESRERGCCRKIQRLPSWFVPRKSRVFLVHHTPASSHRGTLFGYYTATRAEFITAQPGPDTIKPYTGKSPWSDVYYLDFKNRVKKCRGSDNEEECVRSKYSETYNLNFPWDFCKKRMKFYSGPMVKPVDPFDKMVERIFREFINQYWEKFKKSVKKGDFTLVPREQSICETARGCCYRQHEGGIYLVNDLAAEITDAFHEEMYTGPTLKKIRAHFAKKNYDECRNIFRDVKRKVVASTKLKYGEPTLFEKPYPIYEKFPSAFFQGYQRIDGDTLIERIKKEQAMRKTKKTISAVIPKIPIYSSRQTESDKPIFKEHLITHLAKNLNLQKKVVDDFFKVLNRLVIEELNDKEEVTLPDLGKLKLSRIQEHKGRNPQTGEEIDIPAKNLVKFGATKALKDKIKQTPLKRKKKKKSATSKGNK